MCCIVLYDFNPSMSFINLVAVQFVGNATK